MNGRRGALVAGLLATVIVVDACRLPALDELPPARPLPQTSFVYAADGSLLTTFHAEDRVLVGFDQLPQVVIDAVVATEDRRFWDHHGVDLKSLMRAAYVNFNSGEVLEGGSTITEQLVKNRYLTAERTLGRKVREAMLAYQLERRLTKGQILTRYLNTVYFGQGAYGIQTAANTYFAKPVERLGLEEAALLAGLIQAPSAYNPVDHPLLARHRRAEVLRRMLGERMISVDEYREARRARLGLRSPDDGPRYRAPYFVQFVKEWILSNAAFGATPKEREELLNGGGLRIHTTLDPQLQADAEESVGEILVYPSDPYAAMTVVEPATGHIVAMVGGRDFFSRTDRVAQVNLATGGSTGRQAGSAFKPFALIAAIENGIAPETVYDAPPTIAFALPERCQAPGEPVWVVDNYDGHATGTLSLEEATIDSVNVVYAMLVHQLGEGDPCTGAKKVIGVARALGVNAPELMRAGVGVPLRAVPAAVLGAEQVNTVEMAAAYATLANVGYRVPVTPVTRVTDARGRILYEPPGEREIAVSPPIAYVADQILSKVVEEGTGRAADIGRPVIGKTGTTQEYRDAWFVGAIPQLSAAVWVGFPGGSVSMVEPRTRITKVLGGTWPAQIWNLFMAKATRDLPVEEFIEPPIQYVTHEIDISRNCVANRYTPPYLIEEVQYVDGTEPDVCTEPTRYFPLTVPSVIGLDAEAAAAALEEAGFASTTVPEFSELEPGTVVAQSPAAGEQALQASVVALRVAVEPPPATPSPTPTPTPSIEPIPTGSPPASPTETPGSPSPSPQPSPTQEDVAVPDTVGLPQREAIRVLRNAGFGVAVLTEPSCPAEDPGCEPAPRIVWRSRPRAGVEIEPGSTVTLWVDP